MSDRPSQTGTIKADAPPPPPVPDYTLLRCVGRGGCGEIWLAQNIVGTFRAVKIVYRRTFQNDHQYEREFLGIQHFEPVSRSHAGLVSVLHIGRNETLGYFYYVMEVADDTVSGQQIDPNHYRPKTLRSELLRRDRFPFREFLGVGMAVSDALSFLHQRGLVHRDLKPSNIIFVNGAPKIADIGLVTHTGESGSYVGTYGYIPPEGPGSSAADVYSLGKVLAELAFGHTDGQLNDRPPPIADGLSKTDALRMEEIIRKASEPNVHKRYRSALELNADLRKLRDECENADGTPRVSAANIRSWTNRIRAFARAALATRRRRWTAACLGVFGSVAFTISTSQIISDWVARQPLPAQKQLAVLPFATSDADPNSQAFSDGLVDTISAKLTHLQQFHQELWLVPMADIRRERITSARQAKRAFGAIFVLTGSVQRSGDQLRMTLNLVDTATLRQVESRVIDAPTKDIFGLQDNAVQTVAGMLGLSLPSHANHAFSPNRTTGHDVYELYLQGLGKLARFDKESDLDFASLRFEEVLQRDPQFAPAYGGLGETFWRKFGATKERLWLDKAMTNCLRALELDDKLASPHVTLGMIYTGTSRYDEAIQQFQRAVQLDPLNAQAFRELAQLLHRKGLNEAAEANFRKAITLHPFDWSAHNALAVLFYKIGKYSEAEKAFLRVVQLTPDNYLAYRNLGGLYLLMEREADGVAVLQKSLAIRPTPEAYSNLGTIDFFRGNYAEATTRFDQAVAMKSADPILWGNLADALRLRGDATAAASNAYQRAIELAQNELAINPQDAEMRSSLALYHVGLRQTEAALREIRQALQIAPENVNVLFNATLVYEQTANRQLAMETLRLAIDRGYSKSTIQRHPDLAELRRSNPLNLFSARSDTATSTNKAH